MRISDWSSDVCSSDLSGSTKVKEGYIELLVPILADRPFFQRLEVDLAYRYSDYDTVGGVSTYKASGEWEPVDGVLLRGGFQRAIRAPSIGELFAPVEQGVTTSLGNIRSEERSVGKERVRTSRFR